jgi:hypothetical protein
MVFALGSAGSAVAVLGPARVPSPVDFALGTALLLPAVLTGSLLAVRVPASPIGGALAWVGATPAAVFAVERWGRALAAAKLLRAEFPGLPMLLLSQHIETRHSVSLVASGAFGYLLKDGSCESRTFSTRCAGSQPADPHLTPTSWPRCSLRPTATIPSPR